MPALAQAAVLERAELEGAGEHERRARDQPWPRRAATASHRRRACTSASPQNARYAEQRPDQRVAADERCEHAPRPRLAARSDARRAGSSAGSTAASSRRSSPARRSRTAAARRRTAATPRSARRGGAAAPCRWRSPRRRAATRPRSPRGRRAGPCGPAAPRAAPRRARDRALSPRSSASSRTGSRCACRTPIAVRTAGGPPSGGRRRATYAGEPGTVEKIESRSVVVVPSGPLYGCMSALMIEPSSPTRSEPAPSSTLCAIGTRSTATSSPTSPREVGHRPAEIALGEPLDRLGLLVVGACRRSAARAASCPRARCPECGRRTRSPGRSRPGPRSCRGRSVGDARSRSRPGQGPRRSSRGRGRCTSRPRAACPRGRNPQLEPWS